jgi:hypothetical protein
MDYANILFTSLSEFRAVKMRKLLLHRANFRLLIVLTSFLFIIICLRFYINPSENKLSQAVLDKITAEKNEEELYSNFMPNVTISMKRETIKCDYLSENTDFSNYNSKNLMLDKWTLSDIQVLDNLKQVGYYEWFTFGSK